MKIAMMTTWMGVAVCSAALLAGCEQQGSQSGDGGGEGQVVEQEAEVQDDTLIQKETRVQEQDGQTKVIEETTERDLTPEPGEEAVETEIEERTFPEQPQPENSEGQGGM